MGIIDILSRIRPGTRRPELPAAVPGTSMYPGAGQWGEIPLPLASTTTVMGLPAANRAVLLISNAVAGMAPADVWKDGFRQDARPSLLERPNSTYGLFDFFQMGTAMAIMRGNFLALHADFDADGNPQQLVPVPAGFWLAYFDGDGYLVYNVKGKTYQRDQVFHIRANTLPNQPMGIGVVEQFRRSLGHQLDQQNLAADTYRSGSVPQGIIKLDLPEVEQAQSDYVQNQWLQKHSGGAQVPAVLPKTMTFEALQWTPEDLQFLQARQYSVGEMALMFNLDPTDLGATLAGAASTMTYANIEQRSNARIVDSYSPWMRRWEDELSDCRPDGEVVKLDPENQLRTDSKTQAEVDQLRVGTSIRSTDEIRKRDGYKPLPKPSPGTIAPDGSLIPHIPLKPGSPEDIAAKTAAAPAPAPAAAPAPNGEPPPGTMIPGTDITATPVKIKE